MKYPRYPVVATDDQHIYEFYSEGSMGKIRKIVLYEKIGINLFNLAFGDWIEERQEADGSSRSNNGDRDKVLATVAYTTLDFIGKFPNAGIFVEGSTSARTRLYQMGIAHNLMEINDLFIIKGFFRERWEQFQRGRNYGAFLITRK